MPAFFIFAATKRTLQRLHFPTCFPYTCSSSGPSRSMSKTTLLILSLLHLFALPTAASASTLYRCVDDNDHFVYTNYKYANRKCTVMSTDNSRPGAKPARRAETTKVSPADFPKVSTETQRNRDSDRRYILEQELKSEQKGLDDARRTLAEQLAANSSSAPAQVQPIRDRMALHERNVEALRREIANLK